MKHVRQSEESALADRLLNYSDALVAVAFLGVSGLGIAIADPDVRCTIARAAGQITFAIFVNALVFSAVIVLLRRWENDLRSAAPATGKVARYGRWIHLARLIVVWLSLLLSVVLVFASRDAGCEVAPGAEASAGRGDASAPQGESVARSIRPGRSPVGSSRSIVLTPFT